MEQPIYPELAIKEGCKFIELKTRVRKKHRGKWYLFDVYNRYRNLNLEDREKAIQKFHSEVYRSLICIIVLPKLKDVHGNLIFTEDPNQQSEVKRITLT